MYADTSADALKELIALSQQAVAAKDAVFVADHPSLAQVGVVTRDAIVWQDRRPPRREHRLSSLADVARFAVEAKARLGCTPTVWVKDTLRVIVQLDDAPTDQRRDEAMYPLVPTAEWTELTNLASPATNKPFNSSGLRRALATTLSGLFASRSHNELVALIKTLTGLTRSETRVEQRGSGTLDMTVRTNQGAEINWPEFLLADTCPVIDSEIELAWTNLADKDRLIRVRLEIDPAAKSFELLPDPGDFQRRHTKVMDLAHAYLAANCDCPVYRGAP